MKSTRTRKHCPECPEQCFCGSSENLEENHLGGRKHAPEIALPYCRPDHAEFHRNCDRAGVDFRKQSNKLLGRIQALKGHMVGVWMVIESIENSVKGKRKEQNNGRKS